MFKKKPFYRWCLTAAVALVVLGWHIYPRDMADLMVIPEDVSVLAYVWESETDSFSRKWEAGSPGAKQIWELLHATQYSKGIGLLMPLLDEGYLHGSYNSQQGAVILIFEDSQGEKYMTAFFREHMNYTPPDGWLKSYFVPHDRELREKLFALADG